jgi:hypothetical protein
MSYNPSIRWLVPTDASLSGVPDNVDLIPQTFNLFRERVQRHFDFPIELSEPYKICDFRPAFGDIFSDELTGSDFWGHTDWDMIFGDVRSQITNSLLQSNDKILTRGCLALYRNTARMNLLYRDISSGIDYRSIFSTPQFHHFDEWQGIYVIARRHNIHMWDSNQTVFNISPYHYSLRADHTSALRPTYSWCHGQIIEKDLAKDSVRHGSAIHLQKRRMKPVGDEVLESGCYWIAENHFTVEQPTSVRLRELLQFEWRRLSRRMRI